MFNIKETTRELIAILHEIVNLVLGYPMDMETILPVYYFKGDEREWIQKFWETHDGKDPLWEDYQPMVSQKCETYTRPICPLCPNIYYEEITEHYVTKIIEKFFERELSAHEKLIVHSFYECAFADSYGEDIAMSAHPSIAEILKKAEEKR